MIPIADAVCLSSDATVLEFTDLMRGLDVSRVAVYENNKMHIVGLVNIIDIMDPALTPDSPLKPLVRPAHKISPESSVQEALYDLQRHKQPIGLLENPDGTAVGLVNLQDLAQHIIQPNKHSSGVFPALKRL